MIPLTAVILTFDEESNIGRSLERLHWVPEVIVIDSFSSDRTCDIATSFGNTRVVQRAFDTHATQWNFGLEQVRNPWVLTLDADYIVSEELAEEISHLTPRPETNAFFARFIYCIKGHPLRASLYPPRAVLFRKDRAHYVQDGHTQILRFEGTAEQLETPIRHDDRKSLGQWLQAQDQYARLEAEKIASAAVSNLHDSLRKWILPAPILTSFYCLFVKGLIFDGWAGWHYTAQRTMAELILSLRLIERKLAGKER